jgi:hypothetical protein
MATYVSPHLNHVEMVHAPGDRALALELLALLGGRLSVNPTGSPLALDIGNQIAVGFPHDNALYVSEVTPQQWAFESALNSCLEAQPQLAELRSNYVADVRNTPQTSFHFGIRYATRDQLEERIEAIRQASETERLRGKLELTGVYPPGTYTNTMLQAFLYTNVIAAGLLSLGQHIELQWRMDAPPLDEAPVVA